MNTLDLMLETSVPIAHSYGRFLEERLRVPIQVWNQLADGTWKNVLDHEQVTTFDLGQPAIQSLGQEQFQFVLPLGYFDGEMISASGKTKTGDPELFSSMAIGLVSEFQVRQQVANLEIENRQFAEQAIASFEELSFLKCATGQLAQVELKAGVRPLIETVLDSLRASIRAQTVELIFEDSHQTRSLELNQSYRMSYMSQHWPHVKHLVSRFGLRAIERPLVCNACVCETEFSEFEDLENVIIVPVLHDAKLMGWLVAVNQLQSEMAVYESCNTGLNQAEFGTVEALVLNAAASIIATHIGNVDLFKEQENLVTSMVRTLVSALDAKDSYTRGHSERVANYARLVANRLGLDEDIVEEIYLTGLLHDIGKIGIGEETLNHPGDLSDEQFNIIKEHPHSGWAILESIRQLEYVLPGVLFHHERLDGLGYPDGLVGSEIPLVARILGVVDSYDAMTSNRPYRKGMPHDKAAEILRKGSGQQWDSEVVETFLRAEDEVAVIRLASLSPNW